MSSSEVDGDVSLPHNRSYALALREMTQRYERLVEELSVLRQIDELDDPNLDLSEICQGLLKTLAGGMQAENCSLMLLNEKVRCLELHAASSMFEPSARYIPPGMWHGKRFQLGEGVVGWVAQTGRPLRIDDVTQNGLFVPIYESPVEVRSLLCFPLRRHGAVMGVINVSHSKTSFFSVESEKILGMFSERSSRLLTSHMVHQQRRETEEYYRMVSEYSGDAILVFDGKGQMRDGNHAVETLTGIPLEQYLAGHALWDQGVHADDRDAFWTHCATVVMSQRSLSLEYRFLAPFGRLVHFEQRSCPRYNLAGQCIGLVSIIRDITAKKVDDAERDRLQNQLRQSQKMEAIGQLAGGVAHDFNNLLTGIMGNLSLAQNLESMADARPLVREALKASSRAAELVKQLLTVSRKSQAEMRPVDLCGVFDEVCDIIRKTFDRRIELVLSRPETLPPVMADPNEIHVALLNLCVNARDALIHAREYDEAGTLRLTLRAETAGILEDEVREMPEANPGWYVKISVSDTGMGMDEETKHRLFEPFFTTKEPGKGTGLGLATVYGIVKQHNGWITVESTPGTGAVFSVFLPMASEDIAPDEESNGDEDLPCGTETILLVDDEEVVRYLGKELLEYLGYRVFLAEDGRQGLDLYMSQRGEIDLVLLDISMPQLSGYEVLNRIRAVDAHARVIISSGYAMDKTTETGVLSAASGYLMKPYVLADMAKTIRQVLDMADNANGFGLVPPVN